MVNDARLDGFISGLPEATMMQVYKLFTSIGVRAGDTKYIPEWAERRYRQKLNHRVSTLRGLNMHMGKRVRVYSISTNGIRHTFIGRIGGINGPLLRFTHVSHCFKKIDSQPWARENDGCITSRILSLRSLRREISGRDNTIVELIPTR